MDGMVSSASCYSKRWLLTVVQAIGGDLVHQRRIFLFTKPFRNSQSNHRQTEN